MANLFTLGFGKVSDLMGKLAEAGLTAEMAEEVRRNPALAEAIVSALRSLPDFALVHGLFVKPVSQIARVRAWNKEHGLGIPDKAFAEAEKSIPAWPEEEFGAVVLVPYLADKANEDETVTSGPVRTFHKLWACAKAEQEANWRWNGYNEAGPKCFRILSGTKHPATSSGQAVLRWEVIDLGSQRNKKPCDVRSAECSPHAGILAAAALHPEWVKSMDCDKVPYVWLPGYEFVYSNSDYVLVRWGTVPYLCFDRDYREIKLDCGRYDKHSPERAVPSFFRESPHLR